MLTNVIGRLRMYINVLSDLESIERNTQSVVKCPATWSNQNYLRTAYERMEPLKTYIEEHPLDSIRAELENELDAVDKRISAIIDASEEMSSEDPECRRILKDIVLLREWYDHFDVWGTIENKIYLENKLIKGVVTEHVEEIDAFLSAHPVSGNAL